MLTPPSRPLRNFLCLPHFTPFVSILFEQSRRRLAVAAAPGIMFCWIGLEYMFHIDAEKAIPLLLGHVADICHNGAAVEGDGSNTSNNSDGSDGSGGSGGSGGGSPANVLWNTPTAWQDVQALAGGAASASASRHSYAMAVVALSMRPWLRAVGSAVFFSVVGIPWYELCFMQLAQVRTCI